MNIREHQRSLLALQINLLKRRPISEAATGGVLYKNVFLGIS